MQLLDDILDESINRSASDIHLLVGTPPMLRVSKNLEPIDYIPPIHPDQMKEIVSTIANNNEGLIKQFLETKVLDINYPHRDLRFRCNVSFSMGFPTVTMRIIKNTLPPFDSLNIPNNVKELSMKSQGLILVTGKPGSGKSTTMSCLINEINETQNRKILMLESPIEFIHQNKQSIIVQKEIGKYGDCISYHDGVMNSLRENCDILVVGEIRDIETMDATIEMAETGHLVFGTLHTNSCAETIDRIISLYPTEDQPTVKFNLASVLRLVISQRMLRGSYGNLVMIPEVLVVDDQIGGQIKKEKFNSIEVEDTMQSGRDRGNYSLVFSLADAVTSGKITIDQAMKEVDFKRQELLQRLVAQGKTRKYY